MRMTRELVDRASMETDLVILPQDMSCDRASMKTDLVILPQCTSCNNTAGDDNEDSLTIVLSDMPAKIKEERFGETTARATCDKCVGESLWGDPFLIYGIFDIP